MSRSGLGLALGAFLLACALVPVATAQDNSNKDQSTSQPSADQSKPDKAKGQAAQDQTGDPLTRPIPEKRRRENAKSLKHELSKEYRKWLDEDVRWIISDEERKAFMQLSNDEERDKFIEAFWDRRNPNPDSEDNEFKDEHYRRIEYANEHYAAGIPGWKSDRGRIYIVYGQPDEIESHAGGGTYERPMEEGGGETSTYPFEDWRYRYIEGIGQEVIIEFVDTCMCGEFHMTIDRGEKDALAKVPGAGLTLYEEMGLSKKTDRFSGGGLETLGAGPNAESIQTKQFDRLEQYAKLNAPPPIKFKDLAEEVGHHITLNPMPFEVRTDFVKITSETVLVPVTIQIKNRDITFADKDGVQHGVVNIFGRISSLTGKVMQTFEDTVAADVPSELLAREAENSKIYSKAVPLHSGRYKLDVVLKDVNGDRVGTYSRGIIVPDFSEEKLAGSSLIVADDVEPVPTTSIGTGMFVIGTTKVRPRVAAEGKPAIFKRGQKVNFWMQVYNLSVDEKTHKSSATFEYDIVNAATNKPIVHTVDSSDKMGNVGEQVTLQKALAAANLDPGVYRIQIKVSDNISKQTLDPSATFAVE
jgi:GWxTD domain-containing protein